MQVSDSSSRILAGLLEARTGQQLTMSRRWRIETALSSLLKERGIASLDELITILVMGREPSLSNMVVEALLNNETYFFRDRGPFDLVAKQALPQLRSRREKSRRISIWSAGCSTGQEVYSLAMLFAEKPDIWTGWTIDILGTDVSSAVIDRAREGTYTQFEVQRGLGINEMVRWFEESGDGWRATEQLRRMARFQVHNLLEQPPHPGQFDIILCRNVLLYFSGEKRLAAFSRLTSALAEDGRIMLGAGETVIGSTQVLEADQEARGLYKFIDGAKASVPQQRTALGA
jgi:chemotaxis protein methyltransferase CheR